MPVDPEKGFTSDVITDPRRFVGRAQLVRDCIRAVNTPLGLIAIHGRRGVGKSSLLRQVQQMALGDYTLAKSAGFAHLVPERPRTFLTAHYTCDAFIANGEQLLSRLCNDQDDEDGLLRLVPNDGKELVEFERAKEVSGGADLKVISWGAKGIENSKYARPVPGDVVQTFRNYLDAIVVHQVRRRAKRDGLLILLDEFDVIKDKEGLGSLIKSLSSKTVKFAICGIARDLSGLVRDHGSVERLLEEGALRVSPMPETEVVQIFHRAETLFEGELKFEPEVVHQIARISEGYPYLAQLLGKECVDAANYHNEALVGESILREVLERIRSGHAFPTLEAAYNRAIGDSDGRQILLHLLADQADGERQSGKVVLKDIRQDAKDLEVDWVDQLVPRLIDKNYGPVLERLEDGRGAYEFVNPVFRVYVKLRHFG